MLRETLPLHPAAAARATTGAKPAGRLLWDEFRDGFSVDTPGARWRHAQFDTPDGPFIADDGRVSARSAQRGGLHVISQPDAVTGRPAFRRSMAQGPLGMLDHLKWLVHANHTSVGGFPGFDAVPRQELRFEAVIGGRTHGTSGHPFGGAVRNPYGDPRLACVAMVAVDYESGLVCDFMLTNTRLYALYERIPFARTPDHHYAAFTYAVPAGTRQTEQEHTLAIAYDRDAGVVRWLVEGREVYRVDRLGHRIDRRYLVLDHGGVEEMVRPRQFAPGMGLFTILDGGGPDGFGLVRLSDQPDLYFDPRREAPARFVDEASLPESRLFGQGAEIHTRRYTVAWAPAGQGAAPSA